MDDKKLNTPPVPEEPIDEPIDEPEEAPVNEELVDEPAEKGPVEGPIEDGPIDDEPIDEPEEAPVNEELVDEPAEKEPVEESVEEDQVIVKPEPIDDKSADGKEHEAAEADSEELSGEPTEPTGPLNQDLIASAEAEAPAEQSPVFPTDTNHKPKSKNPLMFAMIALLVLAIGGTSVWYFLFRDKGQVSQSQQPVKPAENEPAENLIRVDDKLSDFDLSFLRLENNQDNLIYSPLSIKYALAMLSDASVGETKEQIDAVIGDYTPKAYLNSANRSLANGMFIRTDFADSVKSSYIDTLQNKYYAEVIYDTFDTPDNANKWVEDKTLGIIKNTFSTNEINNQTDYVLINALAIDMKWKNKLQCADDYDVAEGQRVPCISYGAYYPHTNYSDYVTRVYDENSFPKISFNGKENTNSAKVAATYFKYDLIAENGGEDAVRNTVQQKYNEWLADVQNNPSEHPYADTNFNLDMYMEEISKNYNNNAVSSDFYFLNTDAEKVFAKDLQEYDSSTFQYVGIMPTSSTLVDYINNLTAEKVSSLISNLKDVSEAANFKEGVVTKLNGYIPFFKFNFTMEKFMSNLESLGITNVFSGEHADLSNMITFSDTLPVKPHISIAIHKADIDFSNDGIKAAAVTAFGGMGAGGGEYFDYKWDVPVEEIDLTFDKPFLFLIRDKGTGEVWFVGTVYEGNVAE